MGAGVTGRVEPDWPSPQPSPKFGRGSKRISKPSELGVGGGLPEFRFKVIRVWTRQNGVNGNEFNHAIGIGDRFKLSNQRWSPRDFLNRLVLGLELGDEERSLNAGENACAERWGMPNPVCVAPKIACGGFEPVAVSIGKNGFAAVPSFGFLHRQPRGEVVSGFKFGERSALVRR